MSADKAQKQATVYGAACMERSRAEQAAEEKDGLVLESRWTDVDIAFDVGLENWNCGPGEVPVPDVPKRLFNAWIEDWEWDCIHHKDSVTEAKLLQKYGGLHWIDVDKVDYVECVASAIDMEFQGGRDGAGWCVAGERLTDGVVDPWTVHVVVDLMADFKQPKELNVEIVFNEEKRATNNAQYAGEEAAKKEAAKKKPKPPAKKKPKNNKN